MTPISVPASFAVNPERKKYSACSRVSLAIGGRIPNASAVRKMTVDGWPARLAGSAFAISSSLYAARVFSVFDASSRSVTPFSSIATFSSTVPNACAAFQISGSACRVEPDRLRVAAALEVEHPRRPPAVLVVADQRPRRVGRQRRLAGARQPEEDRHLPVGADVRRAVHREDTLQRQPVVHHREDRLLDLPRIERAADQQLDPRRMQHDERPRPRPVHLRIGLDIRRVQHQRIRPEALQLAVGEVDEHRLREQRVVRVRGHDPHPEPMLRIGARPGIDHVQRLRLAQLVGDLAPAARRSAPPTARAFTSPHQIRFSDPGSRTTNLSFGDRPVCTPVSTASGPPSASRPSPRCKRMRIQQRRRRVAITRAPRNRPRARTNRAGRTPPSPSCGPMVLSFGSEAALDPPVAAAQHRHALTGRGDAGHLELGRADHEVDVRGADVRPGAIALVLEHEGVGAAESDVARGVLVDQRVVEDRARAGRSGPGGRRARARRAGSRRSSMRRCALRAAPFSSASISTA